MSGIPSVDEILESTRKGGYYDALPEERQPDYMDKDVAKAALTRREERIKVESKFNVITKLQEREADILYKEGKWRSVSDYIESLRADLEQQLKALDGQERL